MHKFLAQSTKYEFKLNKVTLNITRSPDTFTTALHLVIGIDWGWIVRDPETIIVLVLLSFIFTQLLLHCASNKFVRDEEKIIALVLLLFNLNSYFVDCAKNLCTLYVVLYTPVPNI